MIIDSGFCVLKGILEMRNMGVYGIAFIKKSIYWPVRVHGGDVECISCEWDKTEFNIFVLKEPDYSIMMISTLSCLTVTEGQKE